MSKPKGFKDPIREEWKETCMTRKQTMKLFLEKIHYRDVANRRVKEVGEAETLREAIELREEIYKRYNKKVIKIVIEPQP